ncbi:hypothetical protein M0813_11427 [Anaeramoeba flamelloides]|uniref:Gamma-glutamylcyclotransferase AIG2-like domain-containing protein n=1 Tax=Anaeramoeba flamelloides TaxID=1746091 RepID=A0ABQ8ZFM4_9EUKA|nr:hypothetical protein M0813_11427 [Anaeramoeba flamelloides]
MNNKHPIFCYGSNGTGQLKLRLRNPNIIGTKCELSGYQRIFCGYSRKWGGAVASIIKTNNEQGTCKGSFVMLCDEEIRMLDKFEGCDSDSPFSNDPNVNVYRREFVEIAVQEKTVRAIAYIKNNPKWTCAPTKKYLNACFTHLKEFWEDLESLPVYDQKNQLVSVFKPNEK